MDITKVPFHQAGPQRKATAGPDTGKVLHRFINSYDSKSICFSQKSKLPHKVRFLLTGDLIMRARHRHPPSAFTQFCKHVNPLSPVGLFLTWRQDQVQEINPSYLCVLQNRFYTFIASTNELFILCFVPTLFLSTAQWWHRGFYIPKFCTTHLPKIYKIQKKRIRAFSKHIRKWQGQLNIEIISGYIWNADITSVCYANMAVCNPKYLWIMKPCKYSLQTFQLRKQNSDYFCRRFIFGSLW